MEHQPKNQISRKGLRVWRLYGMIQTAILAVLMIGAGVLTYFFDWPQWLYAVYAAIVIVYGALFIYLFPKIRWERWRYEVREQEIELQHGLFIVKRTLVPMVRVQHVDTEQGPILRKYDLAEISISTAATTHTIPALITAEADELRARISVLARVAEDDV
ncbi:membrane protein [Planococcus glaciei]|uniref:PH domain-containing protein n=1 Tax=Planococcus glaciei TaxID=459472 RepID=A0A7H8QBX4_9BACL|nr:PH domain-containing protein [Planococcus glaciei]ETP68426.1 membrane protein [Planococcus glaciei CHR43]KOF10782.1 membrane protein [Planococcus glaciei]MBX0316565.1 PH domain-containing protein [Planococcus glaciei]QKX50855.1 PH domain-containing protein [Planococcus glaciei]